MPSDDTAPSTDTAMVRLVLARELETINQYEEFARAAATEEARAFFLHLAEEEKEHVAEATLLLRRLDAGQEAHFASPTLHLEHFTGGQRADARQTAAPRPTFTVGSLKRR